MAVEGMDRLRARFRALPKEIRQAVRDEMERAAEDYVALMRRLAPRGKSGKLAASIGWTWGDAPSGAIVVQQMYGDGPTNIDMRITIFAGSDEVFYARFVEFGTRAHALALNASVERGKRQDQGGWHPGATAQPFFFPAVRAKKRTTTRRINATAVKAARRIWGG
ncbi:HK97 gp10 family phage protein [Defluviimonas sp. SAOS-178_SWC]|uniref:HK97 gp10 family phage protein n=1 Tax=Defluviimonas sp. SAOS-178_SWC TaxID=3121287 RepID=UPI003221C4C8